MLGRTLGRLVVEVPKASQRDVAKLSQQIQSLSLAPIARHVCTASRVRYAPVVAFQAARRSFATATRTRAKPGGRTVKKTTTKKKTVTKKKPAAKKAAPKKRATAAKKKTAKKAAPKKKKKVLTEEQKARRKASKQVEDLKNERVELRRKALLDGPKSGHISSWAVFNQEQTKGKTGVRASEHTKETSAKFKNLSASELEHYNHLANQENARRNEEHKRWVQQHSPVQIFEANAARKKLNFLQKKYPQKINTKTIKEIKDDRQVKRPVNARALFVKERFASGDMKNITAQEALKLIIKEFTALSASEQKIYTDEAGADNQRYRREFKSIYGIDPPAVAEKKAATA